jgi:hypothetical protein
VAVENIKDVQYGPYSKNFSIALQKYGESIIYDKCLSIQTDQKTVDIQILAEADVYF